MVQKGRGLFQKLASPMDSGSLSGDASPSTAHPVKRNLRHLANVAKGLSRLQETPFNRCYKAEVLQRPRPENLSKIDIRPVFGDIEFKHGQAQYCIIGNPSTPEAAQCFLENAMSSEAWNLEAPRVLLSVLGGAGNMDLKPEIENSFSEGLVRVAKQTRAWVITGGTASGVMSITGKAMAAYDKKKTIPCIGITSYGSLKSYWRECLQPEEQDDMRFNPSRIVDAPAVRPTVGEEFLSDLEPNHTHLIVCDGGKRGKDGFGQETNFRAQFEHHVGCMFPKPEMEIESQAAGAASFARHRSQSNKSLDRSDTAASLRVMILVNGGPISFDLVEKTLAGGCPVVVCRGSGRAADFLTALKDNGPIQNQTRSATPGATSANRAISPENFSASEPETFQLRARLWAKHMTADADKKTWEDKFSKAAGQELLDNIMGSPFLFFFAHTERLEDVVIGALLEAIWSKSSTDGSLISSLQQSLDLAVRWQCSKHCRDLFARLLEVGKRTVTDMESSSPSASEDLPFRSELQVTDETLIFCETLFEKAAWVLQQIVSKTWADLDTSHLVKHLFDVYPTYMKKFPIELIQDANETELSFPFHHSEQQSVPRLFIWLITHGAHVSAVDVLWLQQENPVHAALAAASAYREAGERESKPEAARRKSDLGDRYERLAVDLVTGLDRLDPVEYLFRAAPEWDSRPEKNLITLAHQLECKDFVNEPFYEHAIEKLWFTSVGGDSTNLKGHSMFDLIPIAWSNSNIFWTIPKIKALAQFSARIVFILVYTLFVLYSFGWLNTSLKLLLFIWGMGLGLNEILQSMDGTWSDYFSSLWNFIDCLMISILLLGIIADTLLVPLVFQASDIHILHALNLLPAYLRLLQMLELTEYFGVLLITLIDMLKDTGNFFILLIVVSLGFSGAITPILHPNAEDRWGQTIFWTFWAIFGDTGEMNDMNTKENTKEDMKENMKEYVSVLGQVALPVLRYILYLTQNVLLVNLLVAIMSDTYAANKENSRRLWAFQSAATVLEFASCTAHALPPPLDMKMSMNKLINIYQARYAQPAKLKHDGDLPVNVAPNNGSPRIANRPLNRQERRSISQLQLKLLVQLEKDDTTEKTEAAQAFNELEGRIRTDIGRGFEKLIDEHMKPMQTQIKELQKKHEELENMIRQSSAMRG